MRDNFFKGLAIRLGVRGLIAIGVPLAVLVMYLMLYMLQGRKPEGLPSVYGKRSGSGATGSGTRCSVVRPEGICELRGMVSWCGCSSAA